MLAHGEGKTVVLVMLPITIVTIIAIIIILNREKSRMTTCLVAKILGKVPTGLQIEGVRSTQPDNVQTHSVLLLISMLTKFLRCVSLIYILRHNSLSNKNEGHKESC